MPAGFSFSDDVKITLAARAAAGVNSLLTGMCRTAVPRPTYAQRRKQGESVRCVYAAWHAHLWHVTNVLQGEGVHVMVSQHRDGEIIARMLERKGFRLMRGSSTRGGAQALREMVRAIQSSDGDLVVTVDGPRGPAGVVKDGVLFAASRTGLPIVPIVCWVDRCWRARSWDRLVIGKPLARVAVVVGEEIMIPRDADRDSLGAEYAGIVAAGLLATEAKARRALAGAA